MFTPDALTYLALASEGILESVSSSEGAGGVDDWGFCLNLAQIPFPISPTNMAIPDYSFHKHSLPCPHSPD